MQGEKQKPRRLRKLPAAPRSALYERHPGAASVEYETAMCMLAKRAGV